MMLSFCQLPSQAYPLRSHPARALVFKRAAVVPVVPTPEQGAGGYDAAEHRRSIEARRRALIAEEDAEILEILTAITPLL